MLFTFIWLELVFILLLKILLTIFDLSTLTVRQKVLLCKIFVEILLWCLLVLPWCCAHSLLRRISLLLILCLNVFSLKLNLLQIILLIVLSKNCIVFLWKHQRVESKQKLNSKKKKNMFWKSLNIYEIEFPKNYSYWLFVPWTWLLMT